MDIFAKNTRISHFVTIRSVGGELFHADRRTDMTKLIFAFRNFVNAPEGYKGRNDGAVCYRHPAVPFCIIHCLAYVQYVHSDKRWLFIGERNTAAPCVHFLVSLSFQLIDCECVSPTWRELI